MNLLPALPLAFVAVLLAVGYAAAPYVVETRAVDLVLQGHAAAVDGDTIRIQGERVRLDAIDAPELDQPCQSGTAPVYFCPCGRDARDHLAQLVSGRTLICTVKSRDSYERPVAICVTELGTDIGQQMVRDGFALAYLRYSRRYLDDERAARAAKRGIHIGEFEIPEEWRKRMGTR